jgi:hypothetical protein
MPRKEPLNDRIDTLIQGFVRGIQECPHCAALRKAIVELECIRSPGATLMKREDIDPELVDYFLTRNAALSDITEPNAALISKDKQRTEDNSTT